MIHLTGQEILNIVDHFITVTGITRVKDPCVTHNAHDTIDTSEQDVVTRTQTVEVVTEITQDVPAHLGVHLVAKLLTDLLKVLRLEIYV